MLGLQSQYLYVAYFQTHYSGEDFLKKHWCLSFQKDVFNLCVYFE